VLGVVLVAARRTKRDGMVERSWGVDHAR
jgi:hypothetical protein